MSKKILAVVLIVTVILGNSGCGLQEHASDNIDYNLKQISKGIDKFSSLKNGTLEMKGRMHSEKNAVKDMRECVNSSFLTFILNRKG